MLSFHFIPAPSAQPERFQGQRANEDASPEIAEDSGPQEISERPHAAHF
jgi:hypothetical protein